LATRKWPFGRIARSKVAVGIWWTALSAEEAA